MKVKYILAKANVDVKPALNKAIPLLKGKVGIVTTIQFLHLMKDAKIFLDKNNVKCEILGQILGCNVDVIKNSNAETILYIGDGLFHPKAMPAKKATQNVVIANPISNSARKLTEEEMKQFENLRYRGLAKFHSSKEIGVLVTLKPGQEHLNAALSLKKKFPNKNFYILLFDTVDFNSLEDFSFIECFVNTMCPRISYDDADKLPKPVVDYGDLG